MPLNEENFSFMSGGVLPQQKYSTLAFVMRIIQTIIVRAKTDRL